jgi:hypothetical protein
VKAKRCRFKISGIVARIRRSRWKNVCARPYHPKTNGSKDCRVLGLRTVNCQKNGRLESIPAAQQTGLVVAPLGIITLVIVTLGIIILAGGDPQEAVSFAVCVPVVSRDRPRRVHGLGLGVCGARGIE